MQGRLPECVLHAEAPQAAGRFDGGQSLRDVRCPLRHARNHGSPTRTRIPTYVRKHTHAPTNPPWGFADWRLRYRPNKSPSQRVVRITDVLCRRRAARRVQRCSRLLREMAGIPTIRFCCLIVVFVLSLWAWFDVVVMLHQTTHGSMPLRHVLWLHIHREALSSYRLCRAPCCCHCRDYSTSSPTARASLSDGSATTRAPKSRRRSVPRGARFGLPSLRSHK